MTVPSNTEVDNEIVPSHSSKASNNNATTSGPQISETALENFVVTDSDLEDDNDNDDEGEDMDPNDPREIRKKHWQQSPFAVGCVNVTWQDDRKWFRPSHSRPLDRNPNVCCSAYVCGFLGAGRVGNLAVLSQTTEEYDHLDGFNEETGEGRTSKRRRPKLLCVLGPFWPVNFFLTYPLILGVSFWTGWKNLPGAHIVVVVTWSFCTALLLFSLSMVACRDPGVLYRHSIRPPNCDDWKWNDQAKTYRPQKARFDPECQVVVEDFDHTCPWTGTAIGSRNMFWFRIFVTMVPVCIAYAVILNIFF